MAAVGKVTTLHMTQKFGGPRHWKLDNSVFECLGPLLIVFN